MWEALKLLFDTTMFSPHGICLLWEPELLVIHVASDAIIALSYFSIPFALAYFVWKRPDVEFGWVFYAFATFILACGLTHVFSIYTLWVPAYGIEGIVKAVTAMASVATAILLWPLVPKLLSLPSPSQLRMAHAMLDAEAKQKREAQAMLAHSQKMEAIGQLTGGVAHDFNNLLTVISGNLEMAQSAVRRSSEGSQERIKRYTENALAAARRAADLTHRLLAFARKQPLNFKVVNPNDIVAGMYDFFKRTVGEHIKLQIDDAKNVWNIETDQNGLEGALLNLVINARDAMPNGGRLTITLENAYVDEDFAKRAEAAPGRYAVVSVIDTGKGMDSETRERAFEPFFSTKEIGQGTGLGLSQVYGFAKQSGGFATIESEPGHGTCVRVYLPQSLKEAELKIAATSDGEQSLGNGEAILVVEDDDHVREYIVETLTSLNYKVYAFPSASEAVASFATIGSEVELLLTDVVMPGKNGRILSEELLRIKPRLKVLFMTGYSKDVIAHHGRLDTGVELLQKPISQAALAVRLRRLLLEEADVAKTKQARTRS